LWDSALRASSESLASLAPRGSAVRPREKQANVMAQTRKAAERRPSLRGREAPESDERRSRESHERSESKASQLRRLRRIEGQIRGLQKMVEEDRYCADIITQVASVQEALRGVGRELMRNHLKQCAASAIRQGDVKAEAMYDEILELVYKHLR
jgi:DNA-binding FrmR family transcriptional regulator